jgi:hypothetical protein
VIRGRLVAAGVAANLVLLLATSPARAQATHPAPHDDDAFDLMNVLNHRGLHDIDDESWNVYGQLTYIQSYHPAFRAPYTNANGSINSLVPDAETSFTGTFTLFFGVRLWKGGQAYVVPEAISERPFSQLRGIGGAIQNFELQKTGSETPQVYRSRTYLRQIVNLGGEHEVRKSEPQQLGTVVDRRRLVLTAGNFTILDVFDRNEVSGDSRRNFLNMAFMTHAAWDFPSDARGYSWGGTAELLWDDWALRYGRITPPQQPNQLATDFRLWQFYGDQVELEHDHQLLGQDGAVRVLGYRNNVDTGRFADAIAAFEANPADNAAACASHGLFSYNSGNANAPDLCYVRRPNVKVGVGLDLEQHITEDTGVFLRTMVSDGQTEVDAFNSADRSFSVGALAGGTAWHRHFDVTGGGFGMSWISHVHAEYLAMGGVDGFVGDGYLRQAGEGVVDVFYSFNLLEAIWLTADYQHLWHPGYNADRGPVEVMSGRVHAEF